MVQDGRETGFSLELWEMVANDLGRAYKIVRVSEFAEMLDLVQTASVDAAVANISITSQREAVMDFSQPIFESGLQIMVPSGETRGGSIFRLIFSRGLLAFLAISIAALFAAGMVMWRLERNAQPYFDKSANEAAFPAFWWALNLVVNGGFEERPPVTVFGRIFGVFLVISSLFIVSIFVAKVTATLTIDAIQNNVTSIQDLYGKQVGTIDGSTASTFIESRDLKYRGFSDLEAMLAEFENGQLDAIIFDAPILAFYANDREHVADMAGAMFQRENYGFALPSNSELTESINRSLLRIRENGTYEKLYRKWFGNNAEL